jgi:16S rRNA (guanine527-N7)-methyltransferase
LTEPVSPLRTKLSDRVGQLGIQLTRAELALLEEYLLLLARWNRTINLTALPLTGFPDGTLDRLVMEPLAAAAEVSRAPASWIDLGSGGGSPAIPLKIARPALNLTMVESRARKGSFLREAIRGLGLADAVVLTERFQNLRGTGETGLVDLVTVRAVRVSRDLLAVGASLLKPGGELFLFTTESAVQEAAEGFQLVAEAPLPSPGAVLRTLRKELA